MKDFSVIIPFTSEYGAVDVERSLDSLKAQAISMEQVEVVIVATSGAKALEKQLPESVLIVEACGEPDLEEDNFVKRNIDAVDESRAGVSEGIDSADESRAGVSEDIDSTDESRAGVSEDIDSAGESRARASGDIAHDIGALLDIGISYASGSYCVFLMPGDVLHERLLGSIKSLAEQVTFDMAGYQLTTAEKEFEHFSDDPFEADNAAYYQLDERTKAALLGGSIGLGTTSTLGAGLGAGTTGIYGEINGSSENVFSYAYSTEFLREAGVAFAAGIVHCGESTSVFTLLVLCRDIVLFPDHGYCRFVGNVGTCQDAASKLSIIQKEISRNLKVQLDEYTLLSGDSEVFAQYKDAIDAHFIKGYFLKSIAMARNSGLKEALSLSVFKIMQLVCLKAVPKWIENEYLYALPRFDLDMLKLLYQEFESDDALWQAISQKSYVSVIITTYNRSHILPRAVQNILKQTYQNFELIIVDDASTDDTNKVVKELASDKIRYIRNPENKGVSHARNVGIKAAKGDYVVYQDDDDISRMDKLEKLVHVIERSGENVGFCYHETINHIKKIEKISDSKAIVIPARSMSDVKKSGFIYPALLPWNFVACTSMMIKRKCFDKIGLFDEELFAFEDFDMTLRLAREYEVAFVKEPLYDYFQSPDGLLFNENEEHRKKVMRAVTQIDKKFEADRMEYGIESIAR